MTQDGNEREPWGTVRPEESPQESPQAAGYHVLIRRNATGETRRVFMALPWYGDGGSLYWWTDGNFGCDCNRALTFYREDEAPEDEIDCGDTRFTVLQAELPDGRIVQIDAPPGAPA